MKKTVLVLLTLGNVVFSQALKTDGKDHQKELMGKWGEPNSINIVIKNNKLYYVDEEETYNPISKYNQYTYQINWVYDEQTLKMNPHLRNYKTCFAYDTGKQQLALLKKCGSNDVNQYIPRKYKNKLGG